MFSRAEREFLELLAEGPAGVGERRLRERFPNPVYRRKLLWGIRREASAAAEDWALYTRATEREARVLPSSAGEDRASIPTVTEPFAALLKVFARARSGPRRSEPREAR